MTCGSQAQNAKPRRHSRVSELLKGKKGAAGLGVVEVLLVVRGLQKVRLHDAQDAHPLLVGLRIVQKIQLNKQLQLSRLARCPRPQHFLLSPSSGLLSLQGPNSSAIRANAAGEALFLEGAHSSLTQAGQKGGRAPEFGSRPARRA